MNGIERIAKERKRQVRVEGYVAKHDDTHDKGSLGSVAAALAAFSTDTKIENPWWEPGFNDPWGLVDKHRGDRIRQLEIAGALIAAEIDRLLRKDSK